MSTSELSSLPIAALRSLFQWLEEMQTPYSIIGGLAVSLLSTPRVTLDVDVVVWLGDQSGEAFLHAGEKYGVVPRINAALDFARRSRVLLLQHPASGLKIDISLAALPFEQELIGRSTKQQVGSLTLRVPTPEDLIITKAIANRPRDIADIEAILNAHPQLERERIRYWVKEFAELLEMPELLTGLEQLFHKASPATISKPRQTKTQAPRQPKKPRPK
jgi:hypothetical protein